MIHLEPKFREFKNKEIKLKQSYINFVEKYFEKK